MVGKIWTIALSITIGALVGFTNLNFSSFAMDQEEIKAKEILKRRNITIGTTHWNGIYVTGLHHSYQDEIKNPLDDEISEIYSKQYKNKLPWEGPFKGFVFINCQFDDLLLNKLESILLPYMKKRNKKTYRLRTSFFKNCYFESPNEAPEKKYSYFFSEKIGWEDYYYED